MLTRLAGFIENSVGNFAERFARRRRAPADHGDAIREEYDLLAPGYDENSAAWGYSQQRRVFDALRPGISRVSADVRGHLHAVDLGAGTGKLAKVFKDAGYHTTALDISPRMLKICAREKRADETVEHNLMAERLRLPFKTASVQYVAAYGLLEHFENPQPLVDEIARVITPGGAVAMTHEISPFMRAHDVAPLPSEEGGPFASFAHSPGYIAQCFARAGIAGGDSPQGEFLAAQHPQVAPYQRFYHIYVGRPSIPAAG